MVTNVIFATFTFIFFALEGSIMAQGLNLGLHVPLWLGYALSTLIIFPLVIYGMKVLSTLHVWMTPLWLVLMVLPFGYLLFSRPESVDAFFSYQGVLELSPLKPEFRRGMLYTINPVGFGSMIIAAGVSIVVFFGGLGEVIRPYSPLVAIGLAVILLPIFAIATKGRYCLRRTEDGINLPTYDEHGNPSGGCRTCHVCRQQYERPDMAAGQTHDAYGCSLCLSTDKVPGHVRPTQV